MVSFKFGKHLPDQVVGDRFRVEHIITNLLSNAIKFSPNGKEIVIDVSGMVVPNVITPDVENNQTNMPKSRGSIDMTIKITDAGPGISPVNQAKLFNNFVQIRPHALQKGEGSGLGLALCKAIVELHNGTIGVC